MDDSIYFDEMRCKGFQRFLQYLLLLTFDLDVFSKVATRLTRPSTVKPSFLSSRLVTFFFLILLISTNGELKIPTESPTLTPSSPSFVFALFAGFKTFAGMVHTGYDGDGGPATSARLLNPNAVWADSIGQVYILDYDACVVRKVDTNGIISTVGGSQECGMGDFFPFFTTGPFTTAELVHPKSLWGDSTGFLLYIADAHRILQYNTISGNVTVFAGNGTTTDGTDGQIAKNTYLFDLRGMWIDPLSGDLYFCEGSIHSIRRISSTSSIVRTFAGTGDDGYSGDGGLAISANLSSPYGIWGDSLGTIFFTDVSKHCIRRISSEGIIVTIGGGLLSGSLVEGVPATSASIQSPYFIVGDNNGNLFFTDQASNVIRVLVPSTPTDRTNYMIYTLIGSGNQGGNADEIAVPRSDIYSPMGLAFRFNYELLFTEEIGRVRITFPNFTMTPSPSISPTTLPPTIPPTTTRSPTYKPTVATVTGGVITSYVGNGSCGFSEGYRGSAMVNNPYDVWVDSKGNLYIADQGNHRVRLVALSGTVTTVAGTGIAGFTCDNSLAVSCALNGPRSVSTDTNNNLFIGDTDNQRIRRVDGRTGIITTIAGTGVAGLTGNNGPATSALLKSPRGLFVTTNGLLYFAEMENQIIRVIDLVSGIISVFAGTGTRGSGGDGGSATLADLNDPTDIWVNTKGTVFIADMNNNKVRAVDGTSGLIWTFAGTGAQSPAIDGVNATQSALYNPMSITGDQYNNIYVYALSANTVQRIDGMTGKTYRYAGSGKAGYEGDTMPARNAKFDHVYGLMAIPALILADSRNCRVRKIVSTVNPTVNPTLVPTSPTVSHSAAPSNPTFTPSSRSSSQPSLQPFSFPSSCPSTTLTNHGTRNPSSLRPTVRPSFSPSCNPTVASTTRGVIVSIAGNGTCGFGSGSGPALTALVNKPYDIWVSDDGRYYLTDRFNHRVRYITSSDNMIFNYAGNGIAGYDGDGGNALYSQLNFPRSVTGDSNGNIYISDSANYRIRRVNSRTNIITTVVGIGTPGSTGNNGPATSALINNPGGLFVTSTGILYFADMENRVVRAVNLNTGIITLFAGTGTNGSGGDGINAVTAELGRPTDVWVNSMGNVFFTDQRNHKVRMVTVQTGIISTYAGTGSHSGLMVDGLNANQATIPTPVSITGDQYNNVYVFSWALFTVYRIDGMSGKIYTYAGTGFFGYNGDIIAATSAKLEAVYGLGITADSSLLIPDSDNCRVRKVISAVNPTIPPTTAPDSPTKSPTQSPTNPTSRPSLRPFGVPSSTPSTLPTALKAFPSSQPSAPVNANITQYPSMPSHHPSSVPTQIPTVLIGRGVVISLVGNGTCGFRGDGEGKEEAQISSPYDVWVDSLGRLFITDKANSRIRMVSVVGIIMTIAGTDITGYNGDGRLATLSALYEPRSAGGDSNGNIFISDTMNQRIRKVDAKTRLMTTIAGTGIRGNTGNNGPATSALVNQPFGLFVTSSGMLYFADLYNQMIRAVNLSTGIIQLIAGTGSHGPSGDGRAATLAKLAAPSDVWLNTKGDVFIADTNNNRVRVISGSTSIISTYAGTGALNGPEINGINATQSILCYPMSLIGDTLSNLYIFSTSYTIRRVHYETKIISLYAGSALAGYSGDQIAATAARFTEANGLGIDLNSNVLVPDARNCRVRKVYTVSDPTSLPTSQPSNQPTSCPSRRPSSLPTCQPTAKPSGCPSCQPTCGPSGQPSQKPSAQPSAHPSTHPSSQPTSQPMNEPTSQPSSYPSVPPSTQPTTHLFVKPTSHPSAELTPSLPSSQPVSRPTSQPSADLNSPIEKPSSRPSTIPSNRPTGVPFDRPSAPPPSMRPSCYPTNQPFAQPTSEPSTYPSAQPISSPSSFPSCKPTSALTYQPVLFPTSIPSTKSTSPPSFGPSSWPCSSTFSEHPSSLPSTSPSNSPISSTPALSPSTTPTRFHSTEPTVSPSTDRSRTPTLTTTILPTNYPTGKSTMIPSADSSTRPLCLPTSQPILLLSSQPSSISPSISIIPSLSPSNQPTLKPTTSPSFQPMFNPSNIPTVSPTFSTAFPSTRPTSIPTLTPSALPSFIGTSLPPSRTPSHVPSTSPTMRTNAPSFNFLTNGTLPSSKAISVIPLTKEFRQTLFLFGDVTNTATAFDNVRISDPSIGSSFLIFGSTSSLPSSIDLTGSVDFNHFYPLSSPALSQDTSVRSVSVLKDINNDGFNDLIIGDPLQSKAYVLFGRAIGLVGMTQGFTIYGETINDYLGWSVSSLGDVNGDGFNDLVTCGTVVGKCYVIYGRPSGFSDIYLANTLKMKKGFTITSSFIVPGGMAVSDAGDFNGDGVNDLVVSVTGSSSVINFVFVIFGKVSLSSHNIELTQFVNGVDGVRIITPAWSFAGLSLSGGFDYNHDGYDDIIIGSTPFGQQYTTQTSYVVYGKPSSQLKQGITLSSFTPSQGFSIKGAGFLVNGEVGDVNGDGLDDIVVVNYPQWDGQNGVYTLRYSNLISSAPSLDPSSLPSTGSGTSETASPSYTRTAAPSNPTALPTEAPSGPTLSPTRQPTTPTNTPVVRTSLPTARPSNALTSRPTLTAVPSSSPTRVLTVKSTITPTIKSTRSSTIRSTINLTPSSQPTSQPTISTQTNFSIIFIREGGNYSIEHVSRKTQYVITADSNTFITSHSFVSKYTVTVTPGVMIYITNFKPETDIIDLKAFPQITSLEELVYRDSPFTLLLPDGQMIVLGNVQVKEELKAKNFLFSASLPPSSSTSNNDVFWKTELIAGFCLVVTFLMIIIYSCYRRHYTKPPVPTRRGIFDDVEAQNTLIKTRIAPVKETSSAFRYEDYDEREPLVSAAVDNNHHDKSLAFSDSSSSFLSSTSYGTLRSEEDEEEEEREVQSNNLPKKKKREDFSPSSPSATSINIIVLEDQEAIDNDNDDVRGSQSDESNHTFSSVL